MEVWPIRNQLEFLGAVTVVVTVLMTFFGIVIFGISMHFTFRVGTRKGDLYRLRAGVLDLGCEPGVLVHADEGDLGSVDADED